MSIQLFLTFTLHYWHSLTNTVSNRQLKQFSKPWITSGLRKSIKVKNSLLQSGDLVNYKIYRNKSVVVGPVYMEVAGTPDR